MDNCASRCITNSMEDYMEPPSKVKVTVKGIGGSASATYVGTVKWTIEDDAGMHHDLIIPNMHFNASAPFHLLSTQHWAQEQNDMYPNPRGTWAATYHDVVELFWNQNKYKKTVRLANTTNVPLMRSAPDINNYNAYCMQVGQVNPMVDMQLKDQLLQLWDFSATVSNNEDNPAEPDDEANNMWDPPGPPVQPPVTGHPDLPPNTEE